MSPSGSLKLQKFRHTRVADKSPAVNISTKLRPKREIFLSKRQQANKIFFSKCLLKFG
jgi:hypothetical protein